VPVRVDVDIQTAMGEAIDHLIEMGHKEIGWIGFAPETHEGSAFRQQRFEQALRDRGLKPENFCVYTETGRDLPGRFDTEIPKIMKALKQKNRPTAVIAYNETCALAVYEAARRCSLSIPEDLSVIGCDDVYAHVVYPAMTVISLELFQLGVRSAELAASLADGTSKLEDGEGIVELIQGRFIQRNSTARVKPY
jgi:DNA-binding LacI/PurR family transcriptional regulator